MLLRVSHKGQRLASDRVHQKRIQLFCTVLHFRREICKRFLCQTLEGTFHRWFEVGHTCHTLEDEGPLTLFSVAPREDRTLVHHTRINAPLGFHCQPLRLCELLTHFRQFLGQLFRRCHGHSTQELTHWLRYYVAVYKFDDDSSHFSDS